MEITKEELVELIKSTVTALNAKPKEEPKEEVVENACSEEKPVENACSEEKETVSEAPVEEPKEEPKEEEKKEPEPPKEEPKEEEPVEEEKEEVIKIEALNHKPVNTDLAPAWQNLHGQAFWDYLASHPEMR